MSRLFPNHGKFKVRFASDILEEAHQLAAYRPVNKPDIMYHDVLERKAEEVPYTDVYIWTPPCQAFSSAGKGAGIDDPRAKVLSAGIKYIVNHKPRVAIMENTDRLGSSKKFSKVKRGLVKTLEKNAYCVYCKILKATDYQVPQTRKRFIMVAIRKDSYREKFVWPEKVLPEVKLSQILDPIKSSDTPGRLPKKTNAKQWVKNACFKAFSAGVDPRLVPVAVDIDCSEKFQTSGIDIAKTLTRTRGGQGGPWITNRGRRATVNEMLKIQGFKENEVPWKQAGLKTAQIGKLLGNSLPVNMIGHVLSEAMYSAGVTADKVEFPRVNFVDGI